MPPCPSNRMSWYLPAMSLPERSPLLPSEPDGVWEEPCVMPSAGSLGEWESLGKGERRRASGRARLPSRAALALLTHMQSRAGHPVLPSNPTGRPSGARLSGFLLAVSGVAFALG